MALPVALVEVAFNAGVNTPAASRTWTDVSAYVEGDISITGGRGDEDDQVSPSTCSLTFDNRDGRFTPERVASPYYPNVKLGRPLRVTMLGSGNYLTASQASIEGPVDWTGFGGATTFGSSTRAFVGSKSLLVTWPTGGLTDAYTIAGGLIVGQTYTMSAYVWVPVASPAVYLSAFGIGSGPASATTAQWERISYTFVATATSVAVTVLPSTSTTAGQQVFVDAVMLEYGASVSTFTTTSANSTRFTGYVNQWEVDWADGVDASNWVSVSAESRKGRLSNASPIPRSAIATEILADNPASYWPLTETADEGAVYFRDTLRRSLGYWVNYRTGTTKAIPGGYVGPLDEGPMVQLPIVSGGGDYLAVAMGDALAATDSTAEVTFRFDKGQFGFPFFSFDMWDDSGTTILSVQPNFDYSNTPSPAVLQVQWTIPGVTTLIDTAYGLSNGLGEMALNHVAVKVTLGGTRAEVFLNGISVLVSTSPVPVGALRNLGLGYYGHPQTNAYFGHVATYRSALSATRIAAHAAAARDYPTETIAQRVVRLAGYAGVPASEVSVTDSTVVRAQKQMDRTVADVLDELSDGTMVPIYDARDGTLTSSVRGSRYNKAADFTVSALLQQVEVGITPTLDYASVINDATVTEGVLDGAATYSSSDAASIVDNGVEHADRTSLVAATNDAESLASFMVYRNKDPRSRSRQVSFDVTNLDSATAASVLSAGIGTKIAIQDMPSQAASSTINVFVEGYAETISALYHRVSFNTTPGDLDAAWVLDDPVLSVLDTSTILVY
jgi:hypothetical protein